MQAFKLSTAMTWKLNLHQIVFMNIIYCFIIYYILNAFIYHLKMMNFCRSMSHWILLQDNIEPKSNAAEQLFNLSGEALFF